MPDTTIDIIRSRAGAGLGSITANGIVPLLGFEEPDGFGEETSSDEIEEAC